MLLLFDSLNTVRREFIRVLGKLALHFPNIVKNDAERAIRHLFYELKNKV